jgi:hypothetical protein
MRRYSELLKLCDKHYTLGVSTTGEAFAVAKSGPNVARLLRGGRRSLRAELAALFRAGRKTAPNAQALADALLGWRVAPKPCPQPT